MVESISTYGVMKLRPWNGQFESGIADAQLLFKHFRIMRLTNTKSFDRQTFYDTYIFHSHIMLSYLIRGLKIPKKS